jgi:ankyrin repeat protein
MPRTLDDVLLSASELMIFEDEVERVVDIDTVGDDGDQPIHALTWADDVEGVRVLLQAGDDVDATGEDNETPLHIAIHQQNHAMIRLLIDAGASDDIKSDFDETPRELAKWMKVPLE